MRRGGRPGLPNRSTPLIVWAVGLLLALLVVWLVFQLLRPQELREIGPVGAAFASPSPAGQVSSTGRARDGAAGPGPIQLLLQRGGIASHEEPIA